jgi:hypothetical protein
LEVGVSAAVGDEGWVLVGGGGGVLAGVGDYGVLGDKVSKW